MTRTTTANTGSRSSQGGQVRNFLFLGLIFHIYYNIFVILNIICF